MRRLSLLSLPLVLVLLAACTSGTEDTQAQGPDDHAIGPVRLISTPDEVRRPIDAYYPTAEQIVESTTTRQSQVNGCLIAAGIDDRFAYPPEIEIEAFVHTVARDRVTRSSLWGFFDTVNAAKYGYQHPSAEVTSVSIPPQSKQAQQKCPLASEKAPDPLTFVFDWALPGNGPEIPSANGRVLRAVAGWSSCMRDRGFDYKDPLAPLGEFREEKAPSARQIRTAAADIACKLKTNLVGKCLAVQIAYDDYYITQRSTQLRRFRAQFDSTPQVASMP